MELTNIKGVGEKTKTLLNKLNIWDITDVLYHFPRNYDIYEPPICISEIDNRAVVAIDGTVVRSPDVKHVKNLTVITTTIRDKNDDLLKVNWFNMPFLRNTVKYSTRFVFRGRIKRLGNQTMVMEQPEILPLGRYEEKLNQMQPVYSLTKGLSNNQMIKIVKEAFAFFKAEDYLDEEMRKKYDVCELTQAVQNIHFPTDFEALKQARSRLAFDEFFSFIYKMRKMKEQDIKISNQYIIQNVELSDRVIRNLDFELTGAQMRVLKDIRKDIAGENVMQRLVQGDVGSGKTIVAFLAMLDMAAAGLQSVLMVPTEVLAEQHYNSMMELLQKQNLDYEVVLLTGSLTAKQKKIQYEKIETGKALLIIGTHAVFQEKVVYDKLALVVIDEQHRFGVLQRATLMEKGIKPHVLVMSATPIPRTLAIILYGDMDISVIDELPSDRLRIKNCVVTKDYRPKAYAFIQKEVRAGRQAYVICPMVEENDMLEAENVVDYAEVLRQNLPSDIVVEYLHGKMRPEQKNEILRRFEKNEIQVLVSTTVIEVGINVPNATVMMVENSERFSLASLHQLRGRVGRGVYQSYCIFVSATSNKEKLKRLEILNQSNDGFYIASQDLKLRGPGDFFGVRQSGEMQFEIADVYTDAALLERVSAAVDEFISSGNEFIDKNTNNDIVIM
ncbi:MAG: ATP-dependent DNA helicase RecG [Lachnospiraceae bacterium]|nr:ATP-dependent DNA helicase RecG [Lachnospiraceae bacterium]